MDPLVSIQVVVRSKRLSAVRTQIRLNVRMHLLVLRELRWPRKPPLATRTLERFLAGVSPHVVHEERRLPKLSAALRADAGLLAGVSGPLVVGEVSELAEAGVALLAFVRLLASVDAHVDVEDLLLREAASADVAEVRSFARVAEHVYLELVEVLVRPAADGADAAVLFSRLRRAATFRADLGRLALADVQS